MFSKSILVKNVYYLSWWGHWGGCLGLVKYETVNNRCNNSEGIREYDGFPKNFVRTNYIRVIVIRRG